MVETHRFVGISNQDMLGEMIQFDLSTNIHQLKPTIFGIYHLEPPRHSPETSTASECPTAQPSAGWLNHQVASICWSWLVQEVAPLVPAVLPIPGYLCTTYHRPWPRGWGKFLGFEMS